jgi:hypothetical protein
MKDLSPDANHIQCVTDFQELVTTPFLGDMNAICWKRILRGDFSEIVKKTELLENMVVLNEEDLLTLDLSEPGQVAREILLNDMKLLKDHGAAPILNLIRYYERDTTYPFFPTDVYSFHIDRSPFPVDTFLCTYYGESSEVLPNSQAEQKMLVPEIRHELKKLFHGKDQEFESFLSEHFFDLHYQAKPNASVTPLGMGHLWRLAVDFPESQVLPCIHRAPKEKHGETRLLLIC